MPRRTPWSTPGRLSWRVPARPRPHGPTGKERRQPTPAWPRGVPAANRSLDETCGQCSCPFERPTPRWHVRVTVRVRRRQELVHARECPLGTRQSGTGLAARRACCPTSRTAVPLCVVCVSTSRVRAVVRTHFADVLAGRHCFRLGGHP